MLSDAALDKDAEADSLKKLLVDSLSDLSADIDSLLNVDAFVLPLLLCADAETDNDKLAVLEREVLRAVEIDSDVELMFSESLTLFFEILVELLRMSLNDSESDLDAEIDSDWSVDSEP